MKSISRKALLGLLGIILPLVGLNAADITGYVRDSAGEPLMQATVRLLKGDSTFVAGAAADNDGKYTLSNIAKGNYRLEASYIGYAPSMVDVKVTGANVRLEPIVLKEAAHALGEVSVVGVKTPMKVMTDTVEFNADSYLTRPNAVVEDLLKRLPGVEVDSEGKITANGKEVSKILVDGKEFFSDDPKVASKNLPVDMVDRLQVIDRKSDLARLTGVDDGEDETVINLTVKKGMQNGWFGSAEGGYGTDKRYMGSFNISRFQNGNQFTFLGNFNNINELGFTDGNGNRFRRFGGDSGVTTSQAVGINFNIGKEEKLRFGGDVMYSHSDKDTQTQRERQYLFTDSTSYYSQGSNTRDKGHNIRGDFRVLWQPDSFNTLEFRPNFSININKSTQADSASTRAGDALRTLVNQTKTKAETDGHSFELGARLIYTHNFQSRRGRSFSIMTNYRLSNVTEKENSWNYALYALLNNEVDEYTQYIDNHTWSNTVGARLSWTEPLGDVTKGNFLVVSYQATYRWNNADKLVWEDDVYSNTLSNRFRNTFFTQNARIGYKKVTKAINAEVGLTFVPSTSQSTNLTNADKTIPRRNVFNLAPFARFRYKISKNTSFNFNYRSRASEPSMAQLQPVADYSDPLRVVQGNPDLKPSFSHFIMARFQDFNADSQRSIMAMGHVDIAQNSIVSHTTYDPISGGQFTTYENVSGVWSGHLMGIFSMPLRNKKFTINNHLFLRLNRARGFTDDMLTSTFTVNVREQPSIAFRPDNLEFELRPFYQIQTSHTNVATTIPTTVHNFGGTFNGTWYSRFGLSLSTDVNYSATRGYSNGYDTNVWLWNAQLSYQFLRNEAATISLKVHDILNQTKSISRNVTNAYIEDIDTNQLSRYLMVTFSYRFNTFGKGNEPKTENNFGPGGGPGGGGRPSGPPPGGGPGGGGRPF